MTKITLEPADNGIIKRIEDDNINGAGETAVYSVVYEIDEDQEKEFGGTIKFISELLDDLGLNTGSKYDKTNLKFETDWGDSYEPKKEELEEKKKQLELDLKLIKEFLKTYD